MPKHKRIARKTLLAIGEGAHEMAFLKHLKGLYGIAQLEIIIDASNGGSPFDIINTAVKFRNRAKFDRKIVLLDSDVDLTQETERLAKTNHIEVIHSCPICLEGMLLSILAKKVPSSSPQCKEALHPLLAGHPAQMSSYAVLFNKVDLDNCQHSTIKRLCELLRAL